MVGVFLGVSTRVESPRLSRKWFLCTQPRREEGARPGPIFAFERLPLLRAAHDLLHVLDRQQVMGVQPRAPELCYAAVDGDADDCP